MLFLLLLAAQDPGELRPGLAARYEAGGVAFSRVDPKPALAWEGRVHPRLPEGPFTATWTGVLHVVEADSIAFDAALAGTLQVEVAGVPVLEGPGPGPRTDLKAGFHPLRIDFRSPDAGPARLQIGWAGRTFSREPLPPWRLKHAVRNPILDPADLGREAAARRGCAGCHASAFPSLGEPPPGPSLAGLAARMDADAIVEWLGRPHARMPRLFEEGAAGLAERRALAAHLAAAPPQEEAAPGDPRQGKRLFMSIGCVACHRVPDEDAEDQPLLGRVVLEGLPARHRRASMAAFLLDPASRYADGRMPRLLESMTEARNLAAYLLPEVPPRPAPPAAADAAALFKAKRCAACHDGLGPRPDPVPIAKAGPDCRGARFEVDAGEREALAAFTAVAAVERPSPVHDRQRLLARLRCTSCHQRDGDRPPPLEEAGSLLGGAFLQRVPFQRTPRLPYLHDKLREDYLQAVVSKGGQKTRGREYSYRMPAFGDRAPEILRAVAEADGHAGALPEPPPDPDPTLPPLGPSLVGFEGYSCISCHVWKGVLLTEADPGALGPELTTSTGRVRRAWFDRWLEDPARVHPGTPMPQIFKKGQPATLKAVLDGDARRQREALWSYLSLGPAAPSPKPLPPIEISIPTGGPLVAQVPLRMPDQKLVEAVAVLYPSNDLLVFDLAGPRLAAAFTGARILRSVRGRLRSYTAEGLPVPVPAVPAFSFTGYERLPDGVRFTGGPAWTLNGRQVLRDGAPVLELPAASTPPPLDRLVLPDPGRPEGSLERPGYRAIAFPRPRLPNGEDLVMPGAVAADPVTGRVFVASMKTGTLFTLEDPDGTPAWRDYAGGLFQECFAMKAEADGLYVLHRRNLSKVTEGGRRVERVAALPHGVGETYDYAYGLARDSGGRFVLSYAPYANRKIAGSGALVALGPSGPEEVAWGFRNPLGFAAGPCGTIFYTDNQGEWVASSKLGAIEPGTYHGFPNPEQKEHASKRRAPAAVWVPYAWARSINGLAWCDTGGKFGPFEGQIFMAELMYGGAVVRANVERVNGVMQGACFPFWGRGMLGPLMLAFDPKGRLYVGSITEPGWMAQPDRGALFRIDWTGETPFEIRSIHARPSGFELRFTAPVDRSSAAALASYTIEHYRYEVTGAYGSPELDRTPAAPLRATVSADGMSVDLVLPPLVAGRVYRIGARGVRSPSGAALVHPEGAYTLNEIPTP